MVIGDKVRGKRFCENKVGVIIDSIVSNNMFYYLVEFNEQIPGGHNGNIRSRGVTTIGRRRSCWYFKPVEIRLASVLGLSLELKKHKMVKL